MFFIGAAAMCICCRKQGRIKWAQGPLNAQGNWVAFHIPSFQLGKTTGHNWYDLAAYTSETIGGDHVRRFVCV